MDVKQVFDTPIKSCLANRTLPLLCLKLEDLCYLDARTKPAVIPYGKNSCELRAKGVANYLEIPYLPIEQKPLELHVLWATTEGIKWTPLLHTNLLDKEFLCLKTANYIM